MLRSLVGSEMCIRDSLKSFTNKEDAEKWLQKRRARQYGTIAQGRDDKRKTFKSMTKPNGVHAPVPEQEEEEEHEDIDEDMEGDDEVVGDEEE